MIVTVVSGQSKLIYQDLMYPRINLEKEVSVREGSPCLLANM